TYRRAAAAPSLVRDAEAPKLIVSVERQDLVVADYYEVTLPPAAPGTEITDEIEVTYEDALPLCAFAVALATSEQGKTSEYTSLLQVVDLELSPTPTVTPAVNGSTPTIAASPTPTPTPTSTPAGPVDLTVS